MKKIKITNKILKQHVQKLAKDGEINRLNLLLRDWITKGIVLGLITKKSEIDNFKNKAINNFIIKSFMKIGMTKINIKGETLH